MFTTLFQQLLSPRFSSADVALVLLGVALGVWLGFRMAIYRTRGKQPKAVEPFADPKKKGFQTHVMRDLVAEAFDLDEEPKAIPTTRG